MRVLHIYLLIFSALTLSSKEKVDILNPKWRTAEASKGKKKLFVKFLTKKPDSWDKTPLSEQISIKWPYEGAMPSKEIGAQIDKFEKVLTKLSESNEVELSLIMTGLSVKTWTIYSKDYPSFIKEFNKALTNHPRYPIKIFHNSDPEWKYWHRTIEQIMKKNEERKNKEQK